MAQSEQAPLNVICIATYFKGVDFIRECKSLGARVVLITKEKMLQEDWPRESLDEVFGLPNDAGPPLFIDLVSFIAQKTKPDRIIALEEFDVMTAALVREHFCLPGMSSSVAKTFRDKMAMAISAKAAGVVVPDFVPLINRVEVDEFMKRVPPPWIIKPRSDVSAIGIVKVDAPDEVWRVMDERNARENLRERASYYLLAQFIPGEVFHVDSIVEEGRVQFVGVNRYGRPPLEVAHGGGAYISRTVARGSANEKALLANNRKLIKALKLERGAAHAEFIKSDADGQFYFLEIAARVGGAYIAEVLEAATGLNLWREWARMEVSSSRQEQAAGAGQTTAPQRPDVGVPARAARVGWNGEGERVTTWQEQLAGTSPKSGREGGLGSRKLKQTRREYAGIVLSLSKQEAPDTSAYDEVEIVYRVKKRHHAGLIVRSPKLERVEELLTQYAARFADDFIAIVPPLEKAE